MTKLAWASASAGVTGFVALVAGVALISVPAGFIVAGASLLGWAYLADRAVAVRATMAGDRG